MTEAFDNEAFYAALNGVRLGQQMTWKDVSAASGVSASSLSRIGGGTNPDANTLAALLKWSGLEMKNFIRDGVSSPKDPVAEIGALLRADRKLSEPHAALIEEIVRNAYSSLKVS